MTLRRPSAFPGDAGKGELTEAVGVEAQDVIREPVRITMQDKAASSIW